MEMRWSTINTVSQVLQYLSQLGKIYNVFAEINDLCMNHEHKPRNNMYMYFEKFPLFKRFRPILKAQLDVANFFHCWQLTFHAFQ